MNEEGGRYLLQDADADDVCEENIFLEVVPLVPVS